MATRNAISHDSSLHIEGLDAMPAADQATIQATVEAVLTGFSRRNVMLLEHVYTDDADWVNAFGSVKKGRAAILEYLSGLFADDNFSAGILVSPPTNVLRRLTDDVVVLSTHLQIRGQGLVGGGEIALRDNHALHILQKLGGGDWHVVSELFMDVRTDQSYINHG
jgi:uncharacterized protein (TIGR02246 family)